MASSNDPMLDGKTARERNKRFPKMAARGDIRYSSMGCGVVHDGKTGMSRRAYYARQIATCLKYDTSVQAPRLIRNGVVVV